MDQHDNNNIFNEKKLKDSQYQAYKSSVMCLICKSILNHPVMCLSCKTPFCQVCTLKLSKCPQGCEGAFETGKVNIQERILILCPLCKTKVPLERFNYHKESHYSTDCLLCSKTKLKLTELGLKECSSEVAIMFINQNLDFIKKYYSNSSSPERIFHDSKLKNLEYKIQELEKEKEFIENEQIKQANQINLMKKELEIVLIENNKYKTENTNLITSLSNVKKEKDILTNQLKTVSGKNYSVTSSPIRK